MPLPVLLLTRPAAQSAALADRMAGLAEVVIAPVSRIVPLDWDRRLAEGVAGVILTSANAVPAVAHLAPRTAWCVGAATARAAARAGFDVRIPDQATDAGALIAALAAAQPPGPLLHAHGRHLAQDVAGALGRAGVTVRAAPVYAAEGLPWPADLPARLAGRRVVAPVYSPRAAAELSARLAPADGLRLVAISPAAAARLAPGLAARAEIAPDPGAMEAAIRRALAAQP